MSVADGLSTGNPWVAIGTALWRGFTSNSVGFGPGGPLRAFLDRVVAQSQQQGPPAGSSGEPTLRTVIDNTPTQRRTPGGPGYRPPSWQVSPLPRPWIPPATDQEIYDFEVSSGIERGFVGPIPTIPDRTIPTEPKTAPRTVPRTLPRVPGAWRVVTSPWWWILWPSRTADDDTIPGPMPQPIPPRGPSRRPRVRTVPRAPTVPGPYRPPQPRFPADFERPDQMPDTVTRPAPGDRPVASPRNPTPAPIPRPRIPRLPSPVPASPPTGLPFWFPLLPQLLPRQPQRLPRLPRLPDTLTPPQRTPVEYLPPQPFAMPLQTRPANCPPCEQERKRRQRKCTNPIVRTRNTRRGAVRYRTITRKLQCRL